jgi:cyclopropane-fatty-acyl-phospholipid synthase
MSAEVEEVIASQPSAARPDLEAPRPAETPVGRPFVSQLPRLGRGTLAFLQLLDRHVADARIRFVGDGMDVVVGSPRAGADRPDVTVRVRDQRCFAQTLTYGNLGLGEAYMDDLFWVEEGSLEEFLTILLRNRLDRKIRSDWPLALRVLGIRLLNKLRGTVRNVQAHYDIGDDLFESFLDPTLTYSCGYARGPTDTLEEMQRNKLERICQKLRLVPGLHLLDIGCGYAGLLMHAARHHGVIGHGVTVSRRHFEHGRERVAAAGLSDRVHLEFKSYSAIEGRFDRIVSVGMLEHLRPSEYASYFATIARALDRNGWGLVHAIACNSAANEHDPFTQKYIFPDSNQPRLSEMATCLERSGLPIIDVENMARHYKYTCQWWLTRYRAARNRLPYDDRFKRMWEYYLSAGVAAATASDGALYQVLFRRDHAADIPLVRV